jgi:hypothetical protein
MVDHMSNGFSLLSIVLYVRHGILMILSTKKIKESFGCYSECANHYMYVLVQTTVPSTLFIGTKLTIRNIMINQYSLLRNVGLSDRSFPNPCFVFWDRDKPTTTLFI